MRKFKFETSKIYHVFNRGVDKREIFLDKKDYLRFLKSMQEFNRPEKIDSLYRLEQLKRKLSEPPGGYDLNKNRSHPVALVEIICYCLNPNHYHLLLRQISENGISKFMHKLIMGYAHYFNLKHRRSGTLFQGRFKAVEIKYEEQLNYVSAYINGNAEIHKIVKDAESWLWSSYLNYLGKKENKMIKKEIVLANFDDLIAYQQYVQEVIKNATKVKQDMKKYLLE
jgi:putative transposase